VNHISFEFGTQTFPQYITIFIYTMSEMNEWINWIEEVVSKKHVKYYEYKHFSNIQEIDNSSFGKIYRANWKKSEQYVTLKSFLNFDNITVKELIREVIAYNFIYFF